VAAGRIAYSVYQDDKYSIWSIEDPAIMAGAAPQPEAGSWRHCRPPSGATMRWSR
jgi:hypothetical protein